MDHSTGLNFSQKNGAMFMETSAQKGTNVATCFEKLIQGSGGFIHSSEIYHLKNTYEVDENDKNNIKLRAEKERTTECKCDC